MRLPAALLVVVAILSAPGCAGHGTATAPAPAPPSAPEPPLPEGAALTRDPATGTVLFLKGQNLSRELDVEPMFRANRGAGDAEGVARAFLSAYAPIFRLDEPNEELVVHRIDLDKIGTTHVRFDQVYRGTPIPGAELIVHLDRDRRVVLVSGKYFATPRDLELTPKLTADDARAIAAREGGLGEGGCAACAADLVVFAENKKPMPPMRLAWRVGVPLESIGALERTIDAEDGTLLRSLPVALSKKWRQQQR
jgi:hypothetical protein